MNSLESYQVGFEDGILQGYDTLIKKLQACMQAKASQDQPLLYSDIIHCINDVLS